MHTSRFSLTVLLAAALSACGGGIDTAAVEPAAASLQVALPAADEPGLAQASFHAAPVLLDEPDAQALTPHQQDLSTSQAAVASKGLTAERLLDDHRARALASSGENGAKPLASAGTVTTYNPAQIRAAYGLTALASATPAQLGAGQTIYIVNAKHNPNVAAELAAFNAKFGLPACTVRNLGTTATLAKAGASCELVVAYSNTAGALTATAPAYDAGWATEIALDVQWAHATAPLARLVLIEASDANSNSLLGAVALANKMGAGVVSMSFGAAEGSWTTSYDAVFAGAGMSYVAATGDNGAAVSWPAVSSRVLAVSGTSLSYAGAAARSETTWSGTGGGVSAFLAAPSYQAGKTRRSVADVAFNANPYTGQYVATMPQGSSTVSWISAGGTSLSTPQWAGLLAVANALRAQTAKAPLGAPHAAIYSQIAAQPVRYASAFADITTGSNGTCASCAATTGYDTATGWGTPNANALLSTLSGVDSAATPAPVVTAPKISDAAISGSAGKPLSATIAIDAAGASSYSVSIGGAPQGMSFAGSATGIALSWAKPVAGTSTLRISLTDKLGRSASANVIVTIK